VGGGGVVGGGFVRSCHYSIKEAKISIHPPTCRRILGGEITDTQKKVCSVGLLTGYDEKLGFRTALKGMSLYDGD